MGRRTPLTTNQQIAIWCIVVPATISIIVAIAQNRRVEQSIAPVIQMQPQIVNVINNVTKVEREIADLNEIVKQQSQLWENEMFRKGDSDIRVKKINRPPGAIETNASFVILELKKIPIENTVIVSSERGVLAPSTVAVYKNVLRVKFLGLVDKELDKDTDFFNVRYIPDRANDDTPWTIEKMTYEYQECNDKYDNSKCNLEFHFEPRP